MRKDVQYRDLPGGPLMVKFADELPLCSLCSKCGMLSKDMFEDPSSHAFCSICIFESSDRKKIHCKYENKDVSVEEMMPAIDIINIVMDQVVFCPNANDGNSCTKYCSLKDLEGHFLECEKTEIICLSCGQTVKGRDWPTHVASCPQQIMQCRYCVVAVPRCRLELHERLCSSNPNAVPQLETGLTAAMDFTTRLRSDWPQSEMQLPISLDTNKEHLIREAKVKLPTDVTERNMPTGPSNISDVVMLSCPICKRNVKSKNMDKHLSVCQQRTDGPSSLEATQTAKLTDVLPLREAAAMRATVQELPQPQRQERVPPTLPIASIALGEAPHQRALTTQDVPSTAQGHAYPYFQRQGLALPNSSSIANFAERGQLHDQHAQPTGGDIEVRAPIQPDVHLQHHQFALPASPISNFAQERRHEEAAAGTVGVDSLVNSFVMLSVSDVRGDDEVNEHGQHTRAPQAGGYSQVAASGIVRTQPKRSEENPGYYNGVRQEGGYAQMPASEAGKTQSPPSEEAPTEAPGIFSTVWNYIAWVAPSGSCGETAPMRPSENPAPRHVPYSMSSPRERPVTVRWPRNDSRRSSLLV